MLRLPNLTLAASFLLYLAARHFDWNLAAFQTGSWYFNPFCWQFLFNFGGWFALGGSIEAKPWIRSCALLWLGGGRRPRRARRNLRRDLDAGYSQCRRHNDDDCGRLAPGPRTPTRPSHPPRRHLKLAAEHLRRGVGCAGSYFEEAATYRRQRPRPHQLLGSARFHVRNEFVSLPPDLIGEAVLK